MLNYQETPTQEIQDELLLRAGIRLFMKREDLNHPFISGNKWWKLKYNLEEAVRTGKTTLVTYGGAYSNHIYATAAAAFELKLRSIGIIRGEKHLALNPTLSFAHRMGMELRYVSRSDYRSESMADKTTIHPEEHYFIPEGGSNRLAVKGVKEFAEKINDDFDYLCCPVGTGGTLAGLIEGMPPSTKILGFSVLKGAEFLREEIKNLVEDKVNKSSWDLIHDYHFGGYAKATPALHRFISQFINDQNIPLEFIYTGKMMAGIYDLVDKGFFPRGATVLSVHTGGIRE
jgi:1-aminocyclopropane-1-carboxylate deaminase